MLEINTQKVTMNINPNTPSVNGFFGEYRWLSNFWLCDVDYEGQTYPSVEHAYQAAKFEDLEFRKQFQSGTPQDAKRIGRTGNIRKDWRTLSKESDSTLTTLVMTDLLKQKYNNAILKEKLIATGDAYLEETNTWGDCYWGVCRGQGLNILGAVIMRVRTDLIKQSREIPRPKVLNKHTLASDYTNTGVYIGRGSKWGNPFRTDSEHDNEAVVALYKNYLEANPELKQAARVELKGRDLICFCKPKACHGDVLLALANP